MHYLYYTPIPYRISTLLYLVFYEHLKDFHLVLKRIAKNNNFYSTMRQVPFVELVMNYQRNGTLYNTEYDYDSVFQ